jgi:hypothetical protein
MGYTNDYLTDIGATTAADPSVLAEARNRLALVRDIAGQFPGALRTYASGSLSQHTVTHPVSDGDGGLVLNRVNYPGLGPEGGGEIPNDVTAQLCKLLGPRVRECYPNARCGTSKRGPKITFGAPINDQDPSVDLVVALTRREGNGLWIPNLKLERWEPSDPEEHVRLLNAEPVSLRRTRRRVIRLAKVWNKQWTDPGFSSFHLSVLALEHVQPGMDIAIALRALLDGAAAFLTAGRNTPDPAGVSKPLKLLISRDVAVKRLRTAAYALADALAADDDEHAVQTALSRVFRNYVDAPVDDQLARAVAALRPGRPVTTATLGLTGPAATVASTRAYGGRLLS